MSIDPNRETRLYSFRSLATVKLREIVATPVAQGTLAQEYAEIVLRERGEQAVGIQGVISPAARHREGGRREGPYVVLSPKECRERCVVGIEAHDEGDDHFPHLLVDTRTNAIVWHDAMEPEDASLDRDLRALVDLLNAEASR